MKIRIALAGAVVLSAGLLACSHDATTSGTGNVRVLLTDAPLDLSGVSAVNVTVTGVRVYPSEDGEDGAVPLDLPVAGDLIVNLLDYRNGKVVLAASGEVPTGSYQRIRMIVAAAEIVRDDDGDPGTPEIVEDVFIPSGKVDVPLPFALSQDEVFAVTLDFDAQASVQVNETPGNHRYILRPVITPVGSSRR